MAFPDLRTVLLSGALEALVGAAVTASLWSSTRQRYRGTGLWLAAYLTWLAAAALILLRGIVPVGVSILLGTPMVVAAMILLSLGLERYSGREPSAAWSAGLLAAVIAIHAWFSLPRPNLLAREILLSAALLAASARTAWVLACRVDPEMRSAARLTTLVLAGLAAASASRIALRLVGPPAVDLFASGAWNGVIVIAYQVLLIALTLSLLLMVNRRDAAQRERAEEALRESEEKFALAFRTSPHAITITTAGEGRFIDLNEAFTAMTGYSRDESLAGSMLAMGLWFDQRERERVAAEMEARRPVVDLEARFRRKDGSILTALYSAEPILLRGVACVVSGFSDITARKRAEEELRKLSAAVEQSPASVMVTDVRGNIEYVNPRFTAITGYTADQVRGRNPRLLKSGDTPAEEYRALWDTITAGREWHGEFHNKRKDGTLFWERASISPIRDSGGSITHFICLKEDITAHKTLQSQYLQAQKMETVARLAGGVAHDFNNMLQVIGSYAEMGIAAVEQGTRLHTFFDQIHKAADRAADLTRRLLGFARKQTIAPVVLDLNDTVSGMLQMLRRLIGEDIDLAWVPGAGLWPVRIDPSQVDQALGNLAVNARDAITGSGRVTIETRNVVLDDAFCVRHAGCVPGEYVLLAVSDNGCGMSEEVRGHIFEPFFTTKGVGKGTGLGTATVYGIVKQNNGFVDVESELGRGTTFRIYLPRFAAAGAVAATPAATPAPAPRGSETVLVVEDEGAILRMTCQVLVDLGYTALAAGTPGEALRLAAEHAGEIHLLLTDVVMPETNGRDLADRARALRPGLKCLYMSGYPADAIAHHGVLKDGVSFVQKPFSTQGLAVKVREALDRG